MYNWLLVTDICVCCGEKRKDENEDIGSSVAIPKK
jgi:hypothetical protein